MQCVDVLLLVRKQRVDLVPHIPHNLLKMKILRGKIISGFLSPAAAIATAATPTPTATAAIVAGVNGNNIQLVNLLTHQQSYLLNRIDIAPSCVVTSCSLDRCSKITGDERYHLLVDTYFNFKCSPKKQLGKNNGQLSPKCFDTLRSN
jgi:hypothetical protein